MSVPNTGPLLRHFEENATSYPSIKLDLREVQTLAGHIGFEIKEGSSMSVVHFSSWITPEQNVRTTDMTYVNNRDSVLGYIYHASRKQETSPRFDYPSS